jgi:hypothetical protein
VLQFKLRVRVQADFCPSCHVCPQPMRVAADTGRNQGNERMQPVNDSDHQTSASWVQTRSLL